MSSFTIGRQLGMTDGAREQIRTVREQRAVGRGARGSAEGGGTGTSPEQIDKIAGELESYFMRQILAEAHKSSDDKNSLDGGFAGGTFHDMLDGAMADKMALGRGLGLKKVIADSLQRSEASGDGSPPQDSRIKGDVVVDEISRTRALKVPR